MSSDIDTTKSVNQIQKRVAADLIYTFDFTPWLKTGETITGTPTVTCTDGTISLSGVVANSSPVTMNDDNGHEVTIAANMGVQVRVSGGTADTTVELVATAATSDSNTIPLVGEVVVR